MLLLSFACAGTPAVEEAPKPAAEAAISWVQVPEGEDLGAAVAREATKAREAGEEPVAYLGAGWCMPCVIYKKKRDDPRMVEAHAGVRIIEVDVDAYMTDVPAAGFVTEGIPFWVKLDQEGRPDPTRSLDGDGWKDNTVDAMAPALTAFFAL